MKEKTSVWQKIKSLFCHKKENSKPRICLLCDRPNWAFDISAKEIVNQLSDEFCFDIKYVVDKPKLKSKVYDLIHICFWGETHHQKFKFPKNKVLKEISSWRWFDNPNYGPCTPKEMADKYLFDADYVFCISKGLYDKFKNVKENVFLTENGFSPSKFYYQKERKGEMSICWAGNVKDPVKNIENLLIPATKDKFQLHLASDLAHHQMADFYNNSDIYVVCSKNEGEPLPLMEAMACGCFPVANRVGFCTELIRHKENGYLVEQTTIKAYQEAFKWCKDNLSYIREQGKKNAKELFETRRWEIMAQGYKAMYEKCLQGEKK